MNFYTYVYLNPLVSGNYKYKKHKFNYEPFYVGKGTNGRYALNNDRNIFCKRVIEKIKQQKKEPIIKFIGINLSEEKAFILENKLIQLIGRRDLLLGSLTNLTDGGEGEYGRKHSEKTKKKIGIKSVGRIPNKETRLKMSKAKKGKPSPTKGTIRSKESMQGSIDYNTGRKLSKETRLKISQSNKRRYRENPEILLCLSKARKGKHHTEETKSKIREFNIGRKHTAEAKNKISIAKKGKPSNRKGAILTEETKNKMSQSHKLRRRLLCVTL